MSDSGIATLLGPGASFHHLGYATPSIARERGPFAQLGYEAEGSEFVDPVQGVAGCFLVGPGPRIELLENLPGRDTLTPWLKTGVKLYHMAYCVDDIDITLTAVRSLRARVASPPAAAVAFDGRRIFFAMLRNGLLVEFIESARHRVSA